MKALQTLIGLFALLLLGITISGLSDIEGRVDGPASQTTVQQTEMLESDMAMLEQMRASTSPVMTTMIQEDPMWTDPDMIQAQEDYQAQMERMLGKRPGQP